MKGPPIAWSKHLTDPEEQEKFINLLTNSGLVLTRLLTLVDEWEQQYITAETKLEDFEDPNWAAKQAFRNGAKAFAKKLRDHLKFIEG